MKAVKSFLILILLFRFSNAEAQHQPDQLNIGPPFILPLDDSTSTTSTDPGLIAKMPTVDFPEEAKILVWWPDTNIDYNMPNAFSPDSSVFEDVRPHHGKYHKEDHAGRADQ